MQWLPIILARNETFISKVVRFFTNREATEENFSHVGIIEGGLVLESKGGVGCVATKLPDFLARYTYYELAYIPVVSKREAYNFCWKHIRNGTKYDKHRARGFVLRFFGLGKVKDFEHTDKLDCAELVQGASGWLGKIDHISPNYIASISEKKPLA